MEITKKTNNKYLDMVKDIAIYGAGGLGREIACVLQKINEINKTWNLIGFFDDALTPGTDCPYGVVLGGMDALNKWKTPLSIVVAIGSVKGLKNVLERITNPLVDFPNIIAPSVFFFDEESVKIGKGNVITFSCRLSCNIQIGDFNIMNGGVSFGHDVSIGSFNIMFPETRLSGQVHVGDRNFFGARTFVAQGLTVGSDTRIGVGSVILRNTKDGFLYMGNPAKKIII